MARSRSLRAPARAGRRAKRNGFRPRHLQTGEGELRIEVPQVREAAIPFVSKLFPKWHCKRLLRTDPLKALVIGGFVRGLSMRDVESLCEEAGLGRTSKSTVATICAELHERFEAFCRRSLYDDQPGRAVPRRDLPAGPPQRPEGGRDLRLGDRPRTATGRWFPCGWGRGRPRRTGSSSAAI